MRATELQGNPRLKELQSFPAIGWDFDLTLVDSPASLVLQQFIAANPQIRHVIVTFRTHGLVNRVWSDLARYPVGLTQANFADFLHIEEDAWVAFTRCEQAREMGTLKGPQRPAEVYYNEWKGMVCANNSLPVLVDDKVDHVQQGCAKYGIKLFDPLDFLG